MKDWSVSVRESHLNNISKGIKNTWGTFKDELKS